MKIAIQGQKASYHDIARKKYFNTSQNVLHCNTFKEVFESVQDDIADFGLVAIENSLYGSINDVYDLLKKYKFWISGELYLRINHCLVATEGVKISQITEVHSQTPALAQCEDFLDKYLPKAERVESYDTSASAHEIAKLNNPAIAAIASVEAAKLYKLKILKQNIESNHQNYTRFIVFCKKPRLTADANKTSLIVHTDQDTRAGALYKTLEVFATRNINLTKIESRPIVGRAWHYMFYLDFETGINSSIAKSALKQLKQNKVNVIVLGSYLKGKVIE